MSHHEAGNIVSIHLWERRFDDMARRKSEDIVAALKSTLAVLEVEAARIVLLTKGDGENGVLSDSASLVYETVLAMAEDVKQLGKNRAA